MSFDLFRGPCGKGQLITFALGVVVGLMAGGYFF